MSKQFNFLQENFSLNEMLDMTNEILSLKVTIMLVSFYVMCLLYSLQFCDVFLYQVVCSYNLVVVN